MRSNPITPRFYVYMITLPDGSPLYIGKGSRYRVFAHEREARTDCPCQKCEVIRGVWKAGQKVTRMIVFRTNDEQEALTCEADVIAQYDLSILANKNVGSGYVRYGQTAIPKVGTSGERHNHTSDEALRKMLEARL